MKQSHDESEQKEVMSPVNHSMHRESSIGWPINEPESLQTIFGFMLPRETSEIFIEFYAKWAYSKTIWDILTRAVV